MEGNIEKQTRQERRIRSKLDKRNSQQAVKLAGLEQMNRDLQAHISRLEKEVTDLKDMYASEVTKSVKLQLAYEALNGKYERMRTETHPMRETINSLTAERSRFIRKLKRAGIKI